jgi:hypothetical protein
MLVQGLLSSLDHGQPLIPIDLWIIINARNRLHRCMGLWFLRDSPISWFSDQLIIIWQQGVLWSRYGQGLLSSVDTGQPLILIDLWIIIND